MKKRLALILALIFTVALMSACTGGGAPATPEEIKNANTW